MNKKVVCIVVIFILAVILFFYSKSAENKSTEDAEGQTIVESVFPTDWPEELPVPDSGIIVGGKAKPNAEGTYSQYTVDMIWTAEDYNAYVQKCIEAGYTVNANGNDVISVDASIGNWMAQNPDNNKTIYMYFMADDEKNSGDNEIWIGDTEY